MRVQTHKSMNIENGIHVTGMRYNLCNTDINFALQFWVARRIFNLSALSTLRFYLIFLPNDVTTLDILRK